LRQWHIISILLAVSLASFHYFRVSVHFLKIRCVLFLPLLLLLAMRVSTVMPSHATAVIQSMNRRCFCTAEHDDARKEEREQKKGKKYKNGKSIPIDHIQLI